MIGRSINNENKLAVAVVKILYFDALVYRTIPQQRSVKINTVMSVAAVVQKLTLGKRSLLCCSSIFFPVKSFFLWRFPSFGVLV